jgi:hypothetical protein
VRRLPGACPGFRRGRHKLVSRYPDHWELYDVEYDRTEMSDLSKQQPDLLREMIVRYDSWATRCGVLPWDVVRKAT